MGCGCNKNKQNQTQTPAVPQDSSVAFRKQANPEDAKSTISRKLGMVQSFSKAIVSRGISDQKINKPTKQLRGLSCFGNKHLGGELPPCEFLKDSETPGKKFCGGCGCGDKPHTWLTIEGQEYSKLDYPKLVCPLKMPGFSNYESSSPGEEISPITRRYYIEQIDFNDVLKLDVTSPEQPEQTPNPQ